MRLTPDTTQASVGVRVAPGVGRTGSQPAPAQGPEGSRGPGLVVLWLRDQAFSVNPTSAHRMQEASLPPWPIG